MSAHQLFFTRLGVVHFLTSISAVVFILAALLAPQIASANTLPIGVIERQSCGDTTIDIYGYGAGMMYNTNAIGVINQHVSHISATQGCAVVEWETSTPAATLVIFANLSDEPVSIDLEDENFGYPYASTQNNAGIAEHAAVLSGLEPGKAYSYRTVTRSHPSAPPQISDPQVLIAGPAFIVAVPVVVPSEPTAPKFDAEKFPIIPSTEVEVETPVVEEKMEEKVPAAVTAVSKAFGGITREGALFKRIKSFFVFENAGFLESDRYIVPVLLFLGLIFILQKFILPAFNVSLRNPLLYWLFGSIVLAVVSATFMFYYVTLISITLFLAVLAWYLLENVSEVEDIKMIEADKKDR